MLQNFELTASAWVEDAEAKLYRQNIKNENITANTRVDLYIDDENYRILKASKVTYLYAENSQSVAVQNMLPAPSEWALENVTVSEIEGYGEAFTFGTGCTAMAVCTLPAAKAGHQYYGRVMYQADAGFECDDGRFEYYFSDEANGTMVFQTAVGNDTAGTTVVQSAILSVSEDVSSGASWTLRNFIVNGTTTCYRAQPLLVDLTEIFGTGNEPDKDWCDENIGYFVGGQTVPTAEQGWAIVNCADRKPTEDIIVSARLVEVTIENEE